jgi:hypothetical protein
LCKAFVLYREGKGLYQATLSEDRYISKRLREHLGGHMVHELGVAEIEEAFKNLKGDLALRPFFYQLEKRIEAHIFVAELEARIWFAAPQRRYLRAMKTRPCVPGKINASPRLTSQNISPAPFRLSLKRNQSFKSTDWKKKKR